MDEDTGAADVAHDVLGRLDYPMLIVTGASQGEQVGCLVGFWTQCTMDPPRLLVCLSKNNRTYRVAGSSPTLAVHVLSERHHDLAVLFGGETNDEVDKFAQVPWRPGRDDLPILDGPSWLVGRVTERVDFGDHVGFALAILEGEDRGGRGQVGFQSVKDLDPGHEA